jgi:predicted metal-dependent HD superfamily phosphohydrolase
MSILQRSWQQLWSLVGAIGSPDQIFDELCDRYSEAHRKYHTLQHLAECINYFELASAQHSAAVGMALWFHDAVYEPSNHDNEIKSAELADQLLTKAKIDFPAGTLGDRNFIDQVISLILATQHTSTPQNLDQSLLVDIDLAILGANPERFAEYQQQIRAEYDFVPEQIFKQKRQEILSTFMLRPQIYSTKYFYDQLEAKARENLTLAIANLK